MDVLDNIAKKLSEAADYTMKEAEKLTGAAKIKFAIFTKQSQIDDIIFKIGQYCYEENSDPEINNSEPIKAACDEINVLKKELDNLNEEMAVFKKYKVCSKCGTKIDREAFYCFKCGEQQ